MMTSCVFCQIHIKLVFLQSSVSKDEPVLLHDCVVNTAISECVNKFRVFRGLKFLRLAVWLLLA